MTSETVIVVPDDFPGALAGTPAAARLRTLGRVTHHQTRAADGAELAARIAGASVVLNIRAYSKFTAELLARCPSLRIISVWGTGTDHVDLDACRRLGIAVTNTPGANALAVAEHTVALMLAAARQIPRLDRETRQGQWPRGLGVQLHGKTLGIVGLGAIGRHVARLARGLGMRVVAWTYHPDPAVAAELGVELADLEAVLAGADVVSVHVRQTPEATGLIGAREIGRMRRGAILVNTARGPLVDREALADTLQSGHLAAAALDVFEVEPVPPGDPLLALPNAVLTPHCAGMVPEAVLAGRAATYVVPPPAAPPPTWFPRRPPRDGPALEARSPSASPSARI